MTELSIRLDPDLFDGAAREAALRAVAVDALICETLCLRFTPWSLEATPTLDRLDRLDAEVGDRLTEALAAPDGPAMSAAVAMADRLMDAGLAGAADRALAATRRRADHGAERGAVLHAVADELDLRRRNLERWRRTMGAAERAARRGAQSEAARGFAEAAAEAPSGELELLARQNEVAAHLLAAEPRAAAVAGTRGRTLASRLGRTDDAQAFAELIGLAMALSDASPARAHLAAGVLAVERRAGVTAAERLTRAVALGHDADEPAVSRRAGAALALLHLATGRPADALVAAEAAAGTPAPDDPAWAPMADLLCGVARMALDLSRRRGADVGRRPESV